MSQEYGKKIIIKKSIYAGNDNFNIDNFEVFTEEFIKQKAEESLESSAEEWWESLRENWEHAHIINFVEFDMANFIESCINLDGIEHCAGLSEFDIVEYKEENFYVIPKIEITW